jgi:protein-disulfide isomerase
MKTRMLAALALAASIAAPAMAQAVPEDPAFTAKLRASLDAHPEIAAIALQNLEKRSRENQTRELNARTEPQRAKMFAPGFGPFLGNPAGTSIVVEYVDYACPICKTAHTAVDEVVAKRKDVKVVIAMRIIFGPESEKTARFALAADLQGKFPAVHDALYAKFGDHNQTKPDDAALRAIATATGLDYDKAVADMTGPKVNATFANQVAVADQIGVNGTPFFVTKSDVLTGYPGSAEALSAGIK